MNILFTCGGTAGHVNPAVALARIFQQHHPDCQVLFVGGSGALLVQSTLASLGYEVDLLSLARVEIPVAIFATLVAIVVYMVTDKRMSNKLYKKEGK